MARKLKIRSNITTETKITKPEDFDLKSSKDSIIKDYFGSKEYANTKQPQFEFEFRDPEEATISEDTKTKKPSGRAKKAQADPMDKLDELLDKTVFPEGRYASIWESPKLRNKGGLAKALTNVQRPLDCNYEDRLVKERYNYEITYDTVPEPEEVIQDNDNAPEEAANNAPEESDDDLYYAKAHATFSSMKDLKTMNKILPADQHSHEIPINDINTLAKMSFSELQKLSELVKPNKKTDHI